MGANPGWFFDLGLELERQGRFEEALANYDKALTLNPGSVEALNNRGVVLEAMNRIEEALASYDRALASSPDLVPGITSH